MEESEDALEATGALTMSDDEFYSLELTVLKALEDCPGKHAISEVCRAHNIDQYDFKDRWGSLLRHNDPAELLRKIEGVRGMLGNPSVEIAKELGYTFSTVRSIIDKLKTKSGDMHHRTKVNLAHRMSATSGGSVKDARAQLPRIKKPSKRRRRYSTEDESEDSDSDSDSDEEYGVRTRRAPPVKVEKVSGSRLQSEDKKPKRAPMAPPPPKRESSWFDLTLSLLDDLDPLLSSDLPDYLPPRLQLRILSEIASITDLEQVCKTKEADFPLMDKMWASVIRAFSKTQLDAFLYTTVVLHRLGYGYSILSEFLSVPKSLVIACLCNLKLDLTPRHGHSFDVTILLVRKEVMTSGRISDLCSVPKEIGRLIIKRCGQREEVIGNLAGVLERGDVLNRVVWLFERGLSLQAICAVLGIEEKKVAAAFEEET